MPRVSYTGMMRLNEESNSQKTLQFLTSSVANRYPMFVMKRPGSRIHTSCPSIIERSQAIHGLCPRASCPPTLIESEYRSRRVGLGKLFPEIAAGCVELVPTNDVKHPVTEYLRTLASHHLATSAQPVYLLPQVFQRQRAQTFSCSLSNLRSLGY